MAHSAPLISTLVFGLVLAFGFGLIAQRLRLPPLIGYLLAGIAIGPFTPGFVADQSVANQLAEIGVILLMFGVGLHFSLQDLLSVRAIAIPGAIAQIACATLLGIGLTTWLGWPRQKSRRARADRRQDRRLRRRHAGRRQAGDPLDFALHGAHRLARVVPP